MSISCQYDTIDHLSMNRATLQIDKLPGVSFSCTNYAIPSLSLPTANQQTPFYDKPYHGDKINWSDLQVEYLVSSNLSNWLAAFEWMNHLAPAEDRADYIGLSEQFSGATLTVYSSTNVPMFRIRFLDCVITDIGEIRFSEEVTETQFVKSTLSLSYQRYTVEAVNTSC